MTDHLETRFELRGSHGNISTSSRSLDLALLAGLPHGTMTNLNVTHLRTPEQAFAFLLDPFKNASSYRWKLSEIDLETPIGYLTFEEHRSALPVLFLHACFRSQELPQGSMSAMFSTIATLSHCSIPSEEKDHTRLLQWCLVAYMSTKNKSEVLSILAQRLSEEYVLRTQHGRYMFPLTLRNLFLFGWRSLDGTMLDQMLPRTTFETLMEGQRWFLDNFKNFFPFTVRQAAVDDIPVLGIAEAAWFARGCMDAIANRDGSKSYTGKRVEYKSGFDYTRFKFAKLVGQLPDEVKMMLLAD